MRILTLSERTESQGGRELAQLEICRGLASRGHSVTLLYREPGSLQDDWSAFATTARFPAHGVKVMRRYPLRSGVDVGHAALLGRRQRPDVVYVHARLLVVLGAAIASMARCSLVVHLHDPPRSFDRQDLWAARRVDRWIAVSEFQRRAWASTGVPPQRCEVIYNGVDLDRFRPVSASERRHARRELGIAESDRVVLYTGRVTASKGLDVLLRAAALNDSTCQSTVVVCGAPSTSVEDNRYAQQLVEEFGLPQVHWLGWQADPMSGYRLADVVVVPSVQHDSFPLVPLEAMACGLPVVVSSAGGLPESAGLLDPTLVVPQGDVRALAARLCEVLDGPDASRLGSRARAVAERHFDQGQLLREVEALLAGVAERAHVSRWPAGATKRL